LVEVTGTQYAHEKEKTGGKCAEGLVLHKVDQVAEALQDGVLGGVNANFGAGRIG
jgi:hypothetical protein